MKQPIQMDELLERVSGNMEFVILMMDTFYNSSEERLSTMEREFEARNYDELADRAHQLKGIVGNLSIKEALVLLKKLHEEARMKNDKQIKKLLVKLRQSIDKAHQFYLTDPIFKK
jgi:HPt (histidine-containing phosphotransfer) domain-containing protein